MEQKRKEGTDALFEKSNNSDGRFVKWFKELNKDSGKIAGGKGANLSEIYNLKIPVPPGFVVTAQAYDYFIEKAGLKEKIKELLKNIDYENTKNLHDTTRQIREIMINSKLPKDLEDEILEEYEHLDVKDLNVSGSSVLDILKDSSESVFVAVRSSATTEDLADASFAGQQETFLNVKGKQELLESIKKCFASLFTPRATYYREKKNFKHEKSSVAVVVQKMIDSTKSGVIFSKDPTYKNDNIIIEAVWGLGEGIVSGKISPDRYALSRDLKIIDKKIEDKKIAMTRDASGEGKTIKLKEEISKKQVLKESELYNLSEIALKLEEHYNNPQDIEFAIENEEIFIVQTRPITTLKNRVEIGENLEGEVILEGLGASPGIGSGKIKIVKSMEDLEKIKQGDILVTEMTNPDMVVSMQKSSAIITNEGGMTAHASIVSREMGIPAVVGTKNATTKLKEGEIITVDGSSGKIYKGKLAETTKKEVKPVNSETKTKIKLIVDLPNFAERASKTNIKSVGLTRIEGIIAESGKHPNYFLEKNKIKDYEEIIFNGLKKISEYFEEMWIRTSDIRSDEYSNLEGAPEEKEANPMLGMHGIRYGLQNPEILKAEINALDRISKRKREVGILLPQVISIEEVRKVKEILKEINSEVKLGIMIETPAAVQLIKKFCEEGISFISFGTNDLTQYILAIDRGNEKVQKLYNEMHPAVLYQLDFVIRVCKRNNVKTSICGQAGSKKEMVKFLVEKGIDSISVNADMANEIAEYVSEVEKSLIRGTDEEPREYQPEKDFLEPQNLEEEISEKNKEDYQNLPKIKGVEELQKEEKEESEVNNYKKEKLDIFD
jgi:pyruvate, water dikinase